MTSEPSAVTCMRNSGSFWRVLNNSLYPKLTHSLGTMLQVHVWKNEQASSKGFETVKVIWRCLDWILNGKVKRFCQLNVWKPNWMVVWLNIVGGWGQLTEWSNANKSDIIFIKNPTYLCLNNMLELIEIVCWIWCTRKMAQLINIQGCVFRDLGSHECLSLRPETAKTLEEPILDCCSK